MKYNHARLFKQMMEQGVSQTKILEYFQGEGYSESDVLDEISAYERQQVVSSALKEPPQALSMEHAPALPKREEPLPVKIILIILLVLLFAILAAGMALLLL